MMLPVGNETTATKQPSSENSTVNVLYCKIWIIIQDWFIIGTKIFWWAALEWAANKGNWRTKTVFCKQKLSRIKAGKKMKILIAQRGGKPPRWVPPRPPLNPPLSPLKLVRFLSLPLSPRPAEVPPLPPPLGAPPPRSFGGGDFGLSLSISSVQPVRWELGAVKYDVYVSALKLLFVSVGPTVNQPKGGKGTKGKSEPHTKLYPLILSSLVL